MTILTFKTCQILAFCNHTSINDLITWKQNQQTNIDYLVFVPWARSSLNLDLIDNRLTHKSIYCNIAIAQCTFFVFFLYSFAATSDHQTVHIALISMTGNTEDVSNCVFKWWSMQAPAINYSINFIEFIFDKNPFASQSLSHWFLHFQLNFNTRVGVGQWEFHIQKPHLHHSIPCDMPSNESSYQRNSFATHHNTMHCRLW